MSVRYLYAVHVATGCRCWLEKQVGGGRERPGWTWLEGKSDGVVDLIMEPRAAQGDT